jgi:hypothetical protein
VIFLCLLFIQVRISGLSITGYEEVKWGPLQIQFNAYFKTLRTPIRIWDIMPELIINNYILTYCVMFINCMQLVLIAG